MTLGKVEMCFWISSAMCICTILSGITLTTLNYFFPIIQNHITLWINPFYIGRIYFISFLTISLFSKGFNEIYNQNKGKFLLE